MHFNKHLSLTCLLIFVSLFSLRCKSAVPEEKAPVMTNSIMETSSTVPLTELSNQDIRWNGNYFGLQPFLSGRSAPYAKDLSQEQKTYLLTCLSDPDRFVLAHVLLSLNTDQSFPTSAAEWNGLQVSLKADGSTEIDPSQMDTLVKKWAKED